LQKNQQLAEQAAKAEAADSFHRMVKKRAAEVHKNLRMQKLLPVKEVMLGSMAVNTAATS
jgi:hypothetical protein